MDNVYRYGLNHRDRPNFPDDDGQGFKTNWDGTDTRKNWDTGKFLGERLGWTEDNVSYKLNKWGFRHNHALSNGINPIGFVENRNALVALGCSMTFGTGVNYEQTWPYYVSKELGLDCINLAQPGSGINASYRVAKMWLPVIKPKVVMFYSPNPHRRELWPTDEMIRDDNHGRYPDLPFADAVKSIGPWSQDQEYGAEKYRGYFKMWTSKRETDIWVAAYSDAMKHISRDSKLIQLPVTASNSSYDKEKLTDKDMQLGRLIQNLHDPCGRMQPPDRTQPLGNLLNELELIKDPDQSRWARDMSHPGPYIYREIVAPLFIREYNES
tara:strand:- start:3123 stop:4097 length:975 start_codon:yes stop_codon:yes gene_type:complete